MSEWRPIETAPRDGSDVLVAYWGRLGKHVTIARIQDGHWRSDVFSIGPDVCAWMPLPEPPK
jgi:hypothetical protein